MRLSTQEGRIPRTPAPARFALRLALAAAIAVHVPPCWADDDDDDDGGIRFETLSPSAIGLEFERVPGERIGSFHAFQTASLSQPIPPTDLPFFPGRAYGLTGVAALDFDGDGDLDLFVTNGPGAANSLFANQLTESGSLTFIDQAVDAGVATLDMEAAGTCFGDLDNDGDPELLVLGMNEPNRLFENLGDGSFARVHVSGLEGGDTPSTSCAMGDIDGDGLLDVFVGAAWDLEDMFAIFADPFGRNHPNELYSNEGGLGFADVSASSGIRSFQTLPPGVATITWSAALVDVDLDGDVDIVQADDQGAFPIARDGGIDRGLLHIFLNDGSGQFVNRPIILDEQAAGSWMGVGFGDLDCNGTLDILGSNFGDYGIPTFGGPYTLGDQATRWFLGNGDGTFTQPGLGDLVSSGFGWGNAIADFDLDGDQDMLYLGDLLLGLISLADNPGVVLENIDCGKRFELRAETTGTDYRRMPVSGVALADLDRDQQPDFVAASEVEIPDVLPLIPAPIAWGGAFDEFAAFAPVFILTQAGFVWSGTQTTGGQVRIERNTGSGRGVTVSTLGTVEIVDGGRVNRDGIGAVLSFTPHRGKTVLVPMQGGSSHASQHALEAYFGLGSASRGTVEVMWPGGVRNRLYGLRANESVRLPEIPCSFDDQTQTLGSYLGCVVPSLRDLRRGGFIGRRLSGRLFVSAIRAFFESR